MVAKLSRRNLLPVLAGVIVVLGLVVGVYFVFFSGKPSLTAGTPNPFIGAGDKQPATNPLTGPVEGAGTIVAPHLIRITAGPVAQGSVGIPIQEAAISSTTPGLKDTEVRYVERQSGNVYAFRLHDRTLTRISNKTLPGVVEASWTPDGTRVFARFIASEGTVDHISTYSMRADGGDGYFLESDLASVGVVGSSTLYTLRSGSSGSVASVGPVGSATVKTLFSSPLSAITLAGLGSNFVATTKASSEVAGYSFVLSGKGGPFVRELGPYTGLSTLPDPSGKYILFSYTNRGKVVLAVRDVASHTTIQLPIATLAEKCVWENGSTGLYCGIPASVPTDAPDAWYQGASSFTDRLWHVDMSTRVATLVVDPKTVAEVSIDMVSLSLDSQQDAVIFTNKIDGSLWAYDL